MNYIKKCPTRFLNSICLIALLFSFSCSEKRLDSHLKKIQESNRCVFLDGWEVVNSIVTNSYEDYSLRQIDGDTTYSFNFLFVNEKGHGFYSIGDFVKSFTDNDVYYEMALSNIDTLYFFKCKSNIIIEKLDHPVSIEDYTFEKGKYYYMYKHGRLSFGQMKFFEEKIDSLTKIRGNSLPELPALQINENDTTPIPEETQEKLIKIERF